MPSMTSIDDIMRAALALPPNSRAMLAKQLLKSLDVQDQAIVDAAWAEVTEQRIREVQQGKVTPIPAKQVLQELRNRNG